MGPALCRPLYAFRCKRAEACVILYAKKPFVWRCPHDGSGTPLRRREIRGAMAGPRLLADLYDQVAMPPSCAGPTSTTTGPSYRPYGFSVKDMTESACVAELMGMYQRLTARDQ